MKKLQTAARSAAARSIMASAGALSLVAASLTSVPAAFAAPNASAAAEVNPNASYEELTYACLLYTSPSPRDVEEPRMPSSA